MNRLGNLGVLVLAFSFVVSGQGQTIYSIEPQTTGSVPEVTLDWKSVPLDE